MGTRKNRKLFEVNGGQDKLHLMGLSNGLHPCAISLGEIKKWAKNDLELCRAFVLMAFPKLKYNATADDMAFFKGTAIHLAKMNSGYIRYAI